MIEYTMASKECLIHTSWIRRPRAHDELSTLEMMED